jgi:hypothetical protein
LVLRNFLTRSNLSPTLHKVRTVLAAVKATPRKRGAAKRPAYDLRCAPCIQTVQGRDERTAPARTKELGEEK